MNEEVYENYSGDSADSRADDPKDNENSYEDIYANIVPETQVTRSNDGTISRSNNGIISEPSSSGYRCFRVTVFCLLMLVVFLLVVITILWVKFNNLTVERDQLQTSYNNLNMEKSQLQTSFNNLNMENSQLQTRYNNLNMEKNQLQTSFNNLNMEKNQLQTRFNNLNTEKNQLQTRFNNLNMEKSQLQTSYNNLNTEKSQLQTRFNNLNTEKNQLQTRFNNLNMEKSQLQTRFNNMAAEKERLSQLKKDITTPGWRYFSSSIYYISTEKKSWSESRKDCQGRGADLVIINNSEEQDFVEVWRRNQGVWIGANDRDSEGTWKWVDGTAVNNGFWNPGEPNSYGNEDCAVSGYYTGNGKWDDVSCNKNLIWICEKILNM